MIKKWKVTLPELTGNIKRNAYIYLPREAASHPEKRYPVLYMFDGHNVFFDSDATYGKSWGMKEYLEKSKLPLIVAAVECNHSPDGGRLREYSPFTFTDKRLGHIKGQGRETMQWLTKTFKPYIDTHFPTLADREHTFIAGSSMGGLMALYSALEYNEYFKGAACLSPSVWFAARQMDQLIQNATLAPDTVIYMDYGSNEMGYHPNMRRRFTKISSHLLQKGVHLTARIVPDGNHCEASWQRQIPFFLNTMLYKGE